jgi:hypothetical protein
MVFADDVLFANRDAIKEVGLEVNAEQTNVGTKSVIFWDVMPCCLEEAGRCFQGTYCLHIQGGEVNQAGNQQTHF